MKKKTIFDTIEIGMLMHKHSILSKQLALSCAQNHSCCTFLPHNSQFVILNSVLIHFHGLNIQRSYLDVLLIYLNTFAFLNRLFKLEMRIEFGKSNWISWGLGPNLTFWLVFTIIPSEIGRKVIQIWIEFLGSCRQRCNLTDSISIQIESESQSHDSDRFISDLFT